MQYLAVVCTCPSRCTSLPTRAQSHESSPLPLVHASAPHRRCAGRNRRHAPYAGSNSRHHHPRRPRRHRDRRHRHRAPQHGRRGAQRPHRRAAPVARQGRRRSRRAGARARIDRHPRPPRVVHHRGAAAAPAQRRRRRAHRHPQRGRQRAAHAAGGVHHHPERRRDGGQVRARRDRSRRAGWTADSHIARLPQRERRLARLHPRRRAPVQGRGRRRHQDLRLEEHSRRRRADDDPGAARRRLRRGEGAGAAVDRPRPCGVGSEGRGAGGLHSGGPRRARRRRGAAHDGAGGHVLRAAVRAGVAQLSRPQGVVPRHRELQRRRVRRHRAVDRPAQGARREVPRGEGAQGGVRHRRGRGGAWSERARSRLPRA